MKQYGEPAIKKLMSANIRAKFACLAAKINSMSVHTLGDIQYVDCGNRSDTFNTVFGLPVDHHDILTVTQYYQTRNYPAAWWLPTTDHGFKQGLQGAGWSLEECDIGMYLILPQVLSTASAVADLVIKRCCTAEEFDHFGQVLSAIFAPDNPLEAENVQNIYQQVGHLPATDLGDIELLVGYERSVPIATAALFFSNDNNIVGIFDVATHPAKRHRGYGSALFQAALRRAKDKGAELCVLQASPDGLTIYQRAGFKSLGIFEVWNLSSDKTAVIN